MTWSKQIRTAWAAVVAAALAMVAIPLAAADRAPASAATMPAGPQVSVTGIGNGAYRIEGSFGVDAPPPVVWAVLTDYDNLSSFARSILASNARGLLEQVRLEMLRRGRTAAAY